MPKTRQDRGKSLSQETEKWTHFKQSGGLSGIIKILSPGQKLYQYHRVLSDKKTDIKMIIIKILP